MNEKGAGHHNPSEIPKVSRRSSRELSMCKNPRSVPRSREESDVGMYYSGFPLEMR